MDYTDFRKKLATDRDFAAKFIEYNTPEALVKAAAAEGYTFTVEDIKNNTDILPEELKIASGGINVANSFGTHPIMG